MTPPLYLLNPQAPAVPPGWDSPSHPEAHTLVPGASISLSGPEGRHAVSVKRVRNGEEIYLSDGVGGRWLARVSATQGKDSLTAEILAASPQAPPQPPVTIIQALPKSDRSERALEAATEAGADAFIPWQAHRCIARWDQGKAQKGRDKWQTVVREAAKQSRRAVVPVVADVVDLTALTARVAETTRNGGVALLLHEAATASLGAGVVASARSIDLIIGPEGGIATEELTRLQAAGGVVIGLGPYVLRTVTAGAVALGALGTLTGRWAAAL